MSYSGQCKDSIGSGPNSTSESPRRSLTDLLGGKASSRPALRLEGFIDNLSSDSLVKEDLLPSSELWETPVTGNSPGPMPPKGTYGRMTQRSPTPGLSWDPNRSDEMLRMTGLSLKSRLSQEIWDQSQVIYTYVIIGKFVTNIDPSVQLLRTIASRLERSRRFMFSGVVLGPENLDVLGTKPASQLTVKTPGQNGGMVTEVNKMLLSMNFGVLSTSRMCSDGWIGIQSVWRSKGGHGPWLRPPSGLHPT